MTTVKPVEGSFFLSCSTCRGKSASGKVSTGGSVAGVRSTLALPLRAFAEAFNLKSETVNHAARGISSRIWRRLIIEGQRLDAAGANPGCEIKTLRRSEQAGRR